MTSFYDSFLSSLFFTAPFPETRKPRKMDTKNQHQRNDQFDRGVVMMTIVIETMTLIKYRVTLTVFLRTRGECSILSYGHRKRNKYKNQGNGCFFGKKKRTNVYKMQQSE